MNIKKDIRQVFVREDYSEKYLSINTFAKTPPKVISIDMSLDFAGLLSNALKMSKCLEHAAVLDAWICKIQQEDILEPTIKINIEKS